MSQAKYCTRADRTTQWRRTGGANMLSVDKLLLHTTESSAGWPAYPSFEPTLTFNPWLPRGKALATAPAHQWLSLHAGQRSRVQDQSCQCVPDRDRGVLRPNTQGQQCLDRQHQRRRIPRARRVPGLDQPRVGGPAQALPRLEAIPIQLRDQQWHPHVSGRVRHLQGRVGTSMRQATRMEPLVRSTCRPSSRLHWRWEEECPTWSRQRYARSASTSATRLPSPTSRSHQGTGRSGCRNW